MTPLEFAEQTVLRHILHYPASVLVLPCQAAHFQSESYRMIYRFITSLVIADKPATTETILLLAHDELSFRSKDLDALKTYLTRVATATACDIDVALMMGITIQQYALLRKLGAEMPTLMERIKGEDLGVLDRFVALTRELADGETTLAATSWSDVLDSAFAALEAIAEKKTVWRVKTNLPTIDHAGILRPGTLCVIGARPHVGKSVLALQTALFTALQNHTALLFSLEMTTTSLGLRGLAMTSNCHSQTLFDGKMTLQEIATLRESMHDMRTIPLKIIDKGVMGLDHIRTVARVAAAQQKLGVVIIDYLQLMPRNNRLDTPEALGEITRGLKRLSIDLDVSIILLSQLNRTAQSDASRPAIHQMKGSGSIEQDADSILLLRPDITGMSYETWRSQQVRHIGLDIAKERTSGLLVDVPLAFDKQKVLFYERMT